AGELDDRARLPQTKFLNAIVDKAGFYSVRFVCVKKIVELGVMAGVIRHARIFVLLSSVTAEIVSAISRIILSGRGGLDGKKKPVLQSDSATGHLTGRKPGCCCNAGCKFIGQKKVRVSMPASCKRARRSS